MQSDSSVILEKYEIVDGVEIDPGNLTVKISQENKFRLSSNRYTFFINLVNPVYQSGQLYIEFNNSWSFQKSNCSIISGFNYIAEYDPPVCYNLTNHSLLIENFAYINSYKQLIVTLDVISPEDAGNYSVDVYTYNTSKSAMIDYQEVSVEINKTYGVNKRWYIHAIRSPVKLGAGDSGPLEILLFLKNQLPQTNVGTMGKIRIEIFPPLPDIPEENGIFTCYFYGDVLAESCTFDNSYQYSLGKTIIYVTTPELRSFKESEIPITITTSAPDTASGGKKGLKLWPLIKRYLFHIHFFTSDCDLHETNCAPSEVYFEEFVPDGIQLTSSMFSGQKLLFFNRNQSTLLNLTFTLDSSKISLTTIKDYYVCLLYTSPSPRDQA
eukprot:TRINITY_DN5492_c0_g1_i2.p1 TRINITY_DN5492_c0_g1~~TRINITY_DN5492_c0_g1_i2.p1  ORF type:complete len:381 (+),score=57.67 TRINITY_DN5492_c0_g1_i2:927-2069(+)